MVHYVLTGVGADNLFATGGGITLPELSLIGGAGAGMNLDVDPVPERLPRPAARLPRFS
jgi:hypothetical protein